MSKNEGKGLKSFNKGFQVPDTYIIIFFVVVFAALMTFLVPKGFYETQDISYMINGVEKTRTVIKDGSFQYLTDDAGNAVTEGVALFSGDGGTGFFNYMYNGIVSSSAIEIIAFLMVVGGAFGIMIRTGAIESGLIGLIRKAKGAEKLLIPVLSDGSSWRVSCASANRLASGCTSRWSASPLATSMGRLFSSS